MSDPTADAIGAIEEIKAAHDKIRGELRKIIVGQDRVIEELLIALFSDGHVVLVGVPGLAKTLLISSLSKVLDLEFNRIQFTPDLMPSDITGTEVLEEDRTTGQRVFKFIKGPVFANLLLADEINRTPPKTQAALLQAMQEKEVSASGRTFPLKPPFFVLATQNPIELEGTYPLPEAQLDRFMFNISVDYPDESQEVEIVTTTTGGEQPELESVLHADDIVRLQKIIRRIPVSDYVVRYAVQLTRATRPKSSNLQFAKDWVAWGAGPRCSQFLILGAKSRAVLLGKDTPSCEDVRQVAPSVFRHRIITNFNAEAEGVSVPDIIERLLKEVPEPARK